MKSRACRLAAAVFLLPLLWSCERQDVPDGGGHSVPEGMVEVRPVLPRMYSAIPRDAAEARSEATRTYDDATTTNQKLIENKLLRLTEGSTVWLIVKNETAEAAAGGAETAGTYIKKSYVVYNSDDDETVSYLVPCEVDDEGNVLHMESTPLYLTDGASYLFYAVTPARKLNDELFAQGTVGFQVKNGELFYANDCRYSATTPQTIQVESSNTESVQEIRLSPMISQTALLRFLIERGEGVHDLDIQPAGIQISGLQNDSPEPNSYGDTAGLFWHMSQTGDEPINLQHGDKTGTYNSFDYEIDADDRVSIEVPILPMWSLSKPVIVVFRLKVNGVPSSYEMMLNEKDFKAGYSYGYRGKVSISDGIDVITWQYVSWEYDLEIPLI